MKPTFDGELIRVTGSVDFGLVPDDPSVLLPRGASRVYPDSPVVHHTVDLDAYIGPGEVAILSMPSAEPGKAVIYMIEANRD